MRHVIISVVSVCLIVILVVGSAFALSAPTPAQATPEVAVVDCHVAVGPPARVICSAAGVQVLNTVLDLPTVTLPPLPQATVTVPGATVTAPGATVTLPPRTVEVEVPVPGPTIRVPGPTETVTVSVPGSNTTATVTLPPKPGATVTQTVRPNGQPVPTETVTRTVEPETVTASPGVSPSGQPTPDRGTLDEDDGFFSPEIDFDDGNVTLIEAGLGALSVFALALVGLLAVYGGYRMGRKSAIDEDTDFLRALLDRAKLSR